ncbi:MAG: Bug family tripartite tricarboxylate transporter substrate binding protein [Burkholderiaceae bacterium]
MTALRSWLSLLSLSMLCLCAPAWSQAWPAKPVRMIIPAPPGSPIDIVARVVAGQMQSDLGQPVLVDNRPGADGSIAASLAAKSAPDGYTLLLGNAGIFTINPGYSDKLTYNPAADFTSIARLATAVLVVGVHPAPGIETLADLVKQAKKEPDKLSYASSTGRSGIAYLSGELLKARAGVNLTWVGYSQDTQALNDLLAGRIAMYIDALGTSLPYHQAGKLKIVAVTGDRRASQIPNVPTIAESGFPGVSGEAWVGFFAPAGTPKDIVDRVAKAVQQTLAKKEISDRLAAYGFDPAFDDAAALNAIIRRDAERWSKLIRELNLRRD